MRVRFPLQRIHHKNEEPDRIAAYENLLSKALARAQSETLPAPKEIEDVGDVTNRIPQDPVMRREKLKKITELGLEHMKQKKISTTLLGHEIVLQDVVADIAGVVEWAEDYIKDAVKDLPYASIVMAGVSLVLPLLKNPTAVEAANQDGFTYVTSQMRYYVAMESLLLPEDMKADLKADLTDRLVGLYKLIIDFQMEQHLSNAETRACLEALQASDPRDDKARIELDKGGLLRDSYHWVLSHVDFQRWRDDGHGQLLWIRGDPGKGKTMLLCGIINELKTTAPTANISFFFCQATDARINNATAVLRGLIYMLVTQEPALISHLRESYDGFGKRRFEGPNSWVALSKIFTSILEDPRSRRTYLIIDALDECTGDPDRLLDLVVQKSSAYPNVKWIVSSRNWPSVEEHLNIATEKVSLCLELNEESVSSAVRQYIGFKVNQLARLKKYNEKTRDAVERHLSSNAHGTFLWVALVCQELANAPGRKAQEKLLVFPPGLDALYRRMMGQIRDSEDAELCKTILAVISAVYRPITLDELAALVDTPDGVSGDYEALAEIVGLCGSFLTLRERAVSFVHQSAKDYLLKEEGDEIFPSGIEDLHYTIFLRSLRDPLAAARYPCIYWVDHLRHCDPKKNAKIDLQDGGSIDIFLREKYLHWLEALSLQRSVSKGVASMLALQGLFEGGKETSVLIDRVHDACRFILYHKWAIENTPLQVYASALVFSPARSITRNQFETEEPKWIIRKPTMTNTWSACLQTLEGHSSGVTSVAWAHDATRLASASEDKTIKIWDPATGECLSTFEGHRGVVRSVAWSRDMARLASASDDNTVKIWDPATGECVSTLKGHRGAVRSVAWSRDASRLASASADKTFKIWNPATSQCVSTLKGSEAWVNSVAWSHDAARLASASDDYRVRIWDPATGQCISTLKSNRGAAIRRQ
ncbi:hypothetical protein VTI74DRAFT_1305 [Chaetomium olivicolor]